jgi:cellulose synthase/poly-beta-1,6-N-acetylglucosamine synthase-like glycosyltransferase
VRSAVIPKLGQRDLPPADAASLKIFALIPAHDETDQIADSLASLEQQSRPPDRVTVIADNCRDETAAYAHLCGAQVMETRHNRHRKAGALNQALAQLLAFCGPDDIILVMDADSVLDPGFIQHGTATLMSGRYAAAGGTFSGKPGGGLVGMLQRNEYARYARDLRRSAGKTLVLTGTATLFRAAVLREVVAARRGGSLPGEAHVYDVRALTEDNELTLAILHLGLRIVCPPECTLSTEVMPTWRDLGRQRLRWKRGALENLTDYGWTRVTRRYWARQAVALLGLLVLLSYLGSLAWSLVTVGIRGNPFWAGITAVFAVERTVSVRARGPVQMAVAAVLLIEMVFDVFLQVVQLRAFVEAARRSERKW